MRFRLIPTDDAFFARFRESAANVAECARRLRMMLATRPTRPGTRRLQAASARATCYLVPAIGSWLDARADPRR
jgi:hypothetical protein